jgi:hypothetical protein
VHMTCNGHMGGCGTRVPDMVRDNCNDSGGRGDDGSGGKGDGRSNDDDRRGRDQDGDSASSDWEHWKITHRRERISAAPVAQTRRRRWSLLRTDGAPAGHALPAAAAGIGAKPTEAAGWAQLPRVHRSPAPLHEPGARWSFSHVENELDSMSFVVRIAELPESSRHNFNAMPAMPSSESMMQAVGALLESGKALLSRTTSDPMSRRSKTCEFEHEQNKRSDTAQPQSARMSSVSSTTSAAAPG